ncbi:hypothetical protein PV325_002066 [Microctonus aethiopoides]|uniref:WKF domain-containing protein n=1 Tax=Microctonus aethiopoides TaxID=144406 RepID=A0AA39FQY9_9HYME|nr:hypothetical protein PV325_002066 [Microctonus aethiopoides]KAK0173991.1 hypothetical protein PV328_007115 [Microctonus aethiopoides]
MVKNLNDKNRMMENTDAETVSEKKIRKKKTKLVTNQNDEDSIKLNEKKHKRKTSDKNNSVNDETPTKITKIANEDDPEEISDSDNKKETKTPKGPSKREIKRTKAAQKELERIDQHKQETTQKALNYLSMWKHARNEWKFMKVKQIWLIDNLLDETAVPDSIFPTVLEYFEGCKGMARETLLKKGMDVIKKYEQKLEESEEITETIELTRARQLLKALPTET